MNLPGEGIGARVGVAAPPLGVPENGSGVPGIFVKAVGLAEGFTGCGKNGGIWQAASKKARIGIKNRLDFMGLLCANKPVGASEQAEVRT